MISDVRTASPPCQQQPRPKDVSDDLSGVFGLSDMLLSYLSLDDFTSQAPISNAPKGNGIGAKGSLEPNQGS